jgi:hypothetical protein
LDRAASGLEKTFAVLIEAESKKRQANFANTRRFPMSHLVSELRFYCGFLNMADEVAAEAKVRSISDVTKYILTAYVRRATGHPQDKRVSGLLAEVIGPVTFTEDAHRAWRNRNYKRLEGHFSPLIDYLYTLGEVIARQA